MIEHVVSRIGGVGLYGVISISLFFAVFVGVLVWTLCLKKPYLVAMRQLPLEDSPHAEPGAELIAKTENHDESR
jgi:hypothetical protein